MDELRRQLERLGWSADLIEALVPDALPEAWTEPSFISSPAAVDSAEL